VVVANVVRLFFHFNLLCDVQGSPREATVAEYHAPTLPPVLIRHLNIGVVARRNFEAGIDINGIIMGLIDQNSPIEVTNAAKGTSNLTPHAKQYNVS
jgi:hypothetical protein